MASGEDPRWFGGVGSKGGGGVGGEMDGKKCCSEESMCSCLDKAFDKLADALKKIADSNGDKVRKSCSESDLCIKEIEEALRKKWEGPLKTCDECQSMLARGLGGTMEYAIGCAGIVCGQIDRQCSMSDPSTWGKPCSGCGQEVCCCQGGVCLPGPCEEPQKQKYQGWCNPQTGIAAVTKAGQGPPGIGFLPVSITDTEIAALEQAKEVCKKPGYVGDKGQKPSVEPHPLSLPFCDISGYTNGSSLSRIADNRTLINILGSSSQLANAIGKLGIDGLNLENIGTIVSSVVQSLVGAPPLFAEILIPQVAEILGCDNPQFKVAAEAIASFGYVQKMTGANLQDFLTPYRYAMNSACRQVQLDPDKAIAAFLGNAIDYGTLDTYWAINGLCPEPLQHYLKAARAKPVPFELGTMRLRGIINPEQYHTGMRELGYLEAEVSENIFKTREQIPTLSDIISMMVRDADDDALAQQIGLDTQFKQKYGGQLRDWSTKQGIPEKVAQYAWRAHWTIPSPTQLFEFWRRLRKKPEFGGEDKLWKDITAALVQQDILPYWHKHYEAISYIPLGRVDIRRMFQNGSLKEDELPTLYNQLGYSDENAEKLKKFAIQLRNHSVATSPPVRLWNNLSIDRKEAEKRLKDLGYPEDLVTRALNDAEHKFINSPYATAFVRGDLSKVSFTNQLQDIGVRQETAEKIANELAFKISKPDELLNYSAGLVDRQVAEARMTADGMNADIVRKQLDAIDISFNAASVIACQRGIKRRYLSGELTEQDASNELIKRGMVLQRINRLVDTWNCERDARGKTVAAAKLCSWVTRGIIAPQDFINRMKRVGYSADDAARMLEDCLAAFDAKRLLKMQKDAKDQAAANRRAQQAARQAASKAEAEQAKLQRAVDKRAATTARRQKAILSAVSKVQGKCNCDLSEAMGFIKQAYADLQSGSALNPDESIQVLITSIEEWDGKDFNRLAETVSSNAFFVQQESLAPPITEIPGAVILSG